MIKNIIFDFDGVILDSVPTKTEAYRKLFHEFPVDKVEQLINYHIQNGGISRYVKVKYFFEEILSQSISEDEILRHANRYSELTKEELTNPKYMIDDAVSFIKQNYQKYNMHIASGADENDLKYICEKLELTPYFLSINGSPTKKNKIVKNILDLNNYNKDETVFIGDSMNDYTAAFENSIDFYGYNNIHLRNKSKFYIDNFYSFEHDFQDEKNVKITIVTVTYNAAQYLEQTIKSVLEQDYPHIEYIIIDGGSSDGTVEIIKKYEEHISYWISESDNGIYDAMNKAIDVATGDWIHFVNAGDAYVDSGVLKVMSQHFSSNIKMCYGGINIIDSTTKSSTYQPPNDLSTFANKMPCCHQAIFFDIKILRKYKFNTLYKVNADLDLILKIYTKQHKYKCCNEPVVNFLSDGFHCEDKPRGYLDELYVTSKYLKKCEDIYQHQAYKLLTHYESSGQSNLIGLSQSFSHIVKQLEFIKQEYSKIVLYGNGNLTQLIQAFLGEKVSNILDLGSHENTGFVIHPQYVSTLEYELILITLLGREDEVKTLLKSYGVKSDKIKIFQVK